MQPKSQSRTAILLMAILLPPTLVVSSYFILGPVYFSNVRVFAQASGIAFLILFGIWIAQGNLAKKMLDLYPSHRQNTKRIILFSLLNLIIVILTLTIVALAFDGFNIAGYQLTWKSWTSGVTAGAVCTIVNQAVYETNTAFERIRTSQLEAEQLKKAQLQSQFDSLKEQVNPHFLFNSLNSLSSLIATDPARAEEFVEEMSRVYRYLLRSNEDQLTTLDKEIAFIESYILLLRTRFGEGFRTEITIEDKMKDALLPPMTLQLLIENAVKHNIVDPDRPLTVHIYTGDGILVVSNNLQRKHNVVLSDKVGLRNIISRYELLNYGTVQVKETGEAFTVILPLSKNIL